MTGRALGNDSPGVPSIEDRLAFLDLGEADLARLAALRPVLEKHADALVGAFYRHLLSFPETRELLRDPAVKRRLMRKQRDYLVSLSDPAVDAAYFEERSRIGATHVRVGLDSGFYLGAYGLYLSLLTPLVLEDAAGDTTRAEETLTALHKRVLLDAQLAMERYIERREHDLRYLARELSNSGRVMARDLEHQGAELRRTLERARSAERLASLGTLVAGLAHEIGTPMGVIQGHARLLESHVDGEQARWRLHTIQEQIARISRIIQSLLNMARPTTGRRLRVELEPLVRGTLGFLAEKFERRGIRVETSFEEMPSVEGDPERLQQLLLNLLLNAADAMPEGGTLRVELHRSDKGDCCIDLSDSGEGIPSEAQTHVFEPFFTTKPAGQGSGLGLAVVRGIVEDHHGEISLTSTPGQGTTFFVTLPAKPAPPPGRKDEPGAE